MSLISDERVEELLENETKLEAENARLRAALMKYGDHAYDCPSRKYAGGPCQCDWINCAAALANEQKPKALLRLHEEAAA